jgi:hypothetical protein
LKETDMDSRQDLSSRRGGRLAAAGAPQNTALNTGVTGEHGQHQMAVPERVVTEDQGFVFDDWHRHMVSEWGAREKRGKGEKEQR